MKQRLLHLALIPFLTLLAGCSKDSDAQVAQPVTIAAKWNMESQSVTGYDNQGKVIYSHSPPVQRGSYVQYDKDGTYQLSDGNRVYATGTYVYSGKTLTIKFFTNSVQKTVIMPVLELSSSKLKVETDEITSSGHETYTYVYNR
ncbi:lipocalin family protein [Hymenobacter terrestris]|uniref:Lipocalin-like domain-containing protein n=1 Tax=Hymenobacter terrestris TaxID=2748310 RepID=A0ABX2Q4D4_9BACT|nr:lipocalin family protein [Hymenobacter terrestris]NVO85404.1 hypothetical protein [Hymenobacter terrestris]